MMQRNSIEKSLKIQTNLQKQVANQRSIEIPNFWFTKNKSISVQRNFKKFIFKSSIPDPDIFEGNPHLQI
jgi:hypothetical protein